MYLIKEATLGTMNIVFVEKGNETQSHSIPPLLKLTSTPTYSYEPYCSPIIFETRSYICLCF